MGYNYGPEFGYGMMGSGFGLFLSPWIYIILAWTLYWKGKALWRAARLGQFEWFVALLVINTVGILEIAYLYYFTSEDEEKKEKRE